MRRKRQGFASFGLTFGARNVTILSWFGKGAAIQRLFARFRASGVKRMHPARGQPKDEEEGR
jgi:hypothetical protein